MVSSKTYFYFLVSVGEKHATNVPVEISCGGKITVEHVNEKADGVHKLGEFEFISGDSITIQNKGTDGAVIADVMELKPMTGNQINSQYLGTEIQWREIKNGKGKYQI